VALYHGLYGLRTILFELTLKPGVEKAVSLVLLVVGLGLFGLGAWAAFATHAIAIAAEPGGSHAGRDQFPRHPIQSGNRPGAVRQDLPGAGARRHDRARRAALHQGQPGRITGMALFVPHGHLRLVRHAAERAATLACNTQILHIATTDLTVGPLPNFDIIRDLVPDLTTMFDKHMR